MDAINSPQFSQQKLGVMINIVPISERLGWFIANPNGRWFVIESNVLTFAWLDRGQTCYSLHILTWEMSGKLHGRTHISQKPALESAASSHSLWVIFRSVKTPVYPKCFLVFFPFFFYPSGKRLHCELERSTMPFNGKIHYFDWAMASIANCWHNQAG